MAWLPSVLGQTLTISLQPPDQVVVQGSQLVISVGASDSNVSYQWYQNGVPVSDTNGYSIQYISAPLTAAGEYYVVITEGSETVTSRTATITVNPATPPSISGQPQDLAVLEGAADAEIDVQVSGSPPFQYQWFQGGSAVSPPQTSSISPISLILENISTSDAGTYYAVISNIVGTVTTDSATVTVNTPAPPIIESQPQDTSVLGGEDANLSVTAYVPGLNSTDGLSYQWFLNGLAIPSAVSAVIDIPSTQSADEGPYYVVITDAGGSITSATATLTVGPAASAPVITTQPTSQTAPLGGSVTFTAVATGNPAPTYFWSLDGNIISGSSSGSLTISGIQLNDQGIYTCSAENSINFISNYALTNSVVLGISSPGVSPTIVTQPRDATVAAGNPAIFAVISASAGPVQYQWFKGVVPISGQVGTMLTFASPQPSDSGNYSVTITSPYGSVTSRQAVLTVVGGAPPPTFSTEPMDESVSADGNATFTSQATNNATYQWYFAGQPIPGATGADLTIYNAQADDAGFYSVTATNPAGSNASFTVELFVGGPPAPPSPTNPSPTAPTQAPTITTQPQDQTVAVGLVATFWAGASDSGPTTYQWYFDGAPIAGATSPILTIPDAQSADGGSYTVSVSNVVGSASSNSATLTVNSAGTGVPLTLAQQPASQTIATGGTVVFTAIANGASSAEPMIQPKEVAKASARTALGVQDSNNPSYQWFFEGDPVPGETSSTLVINDSTSADDGAYNCLVTTSSDSVLSAPAMLTVLDTADPGRLINISCRAMVGTGANVLIAGFVTGGDGTSGTESLLIRGSGPALIPLGVSDTLEDPLLQFSNSSGLIATNNSWAGNSDIAASAAMLGAFAWNSSSSKDSALLQTVASGPYTAEISGAADDTGVALAEVYDATPKGSYRLSSPRLINISARVQVGTSGNILIAGFVVGGSTSMTVLIRASGPALIPFNVAGTLSDPTLGLYSGSTQIGTNTGWGGDTQIAAISAAVGAFPWLNASSKDSALLVTLAPGAYTAQVSGTSGDTGVALVEVYEVQ